MDDFEIGLTEEAMTNIEELTTPLETPKSEYFPYARTVNLGNGGKRGVGFPMATWTFALLEVEQRDQLKEFCPDASAEVFIRTKMNDDTYALFSATMLWTDTEDRWYGVKRNYQIIFRHLVLIPEGS
jgi:hypothetical protein